MRLPIAIYFHSFKIFIIQIGEMAFCKPKFMDYQVKLFSELLQNHPKTIRTSAQTSISHTSALKWPVTA
jgi:hypothetical protein